MYVPAHFQEDELTILHDTIRQAGLATLVTVGASGPEASHVPVILDATAGPYGTLSGHLARANPQGFPARQDLPALAIFLGPDAYISPSWYGTKQQSGKVVPTWNYAAIHASGPLETFDDPQQLLALVTQLTERHEAGRRDPWTVSQAPADYIQAQLKGIIGFRLPIARIEGKWKMSQNRSDSDRHGAINGLLAEQNPAATACAQAMAKRIP